MSQVDLKALKQSISSMNYTIAKKRVYVYIFLRERSARLIQIT